MFLQFCLHCVTLTRLCNLEHMDHPGRYEDRPTSTNKRPKHLKRDFEERGKSIANCLCMNGTVAGLYSQKVHVNICFFSFDLSFAAFTVGVGGPVGSGKTALLLALCKQLRDAYNIAAVTNVSMINIIR